MIKLCVHIKVKEAASIVSEDSAYMRERNMPKSYPKNSSP